jgi:hypothetical protein
MLYKQKILACYPHVLTKSIHKMVNCTQIYVYQVIKVCGLKPLSKITTVSKTNKRSEFIIYYD